MEHRGPASNGAAGPLPRPDEGVRLVRWPEEAQLLERLRAERAPRLLLVRSPLPPPKVSDCEEDWVRLPADDGDVRARVRALATRSTRHRPAPQVSPDGRLRSGDGWVALSPVEHRLAELLADRFGEVVGTDVLARAARPGEPATNGALRVHMTRLRGRLRRLSLELRNVRGHGYVMEHATTGS